MFKQGRPQRKYRRLLWFLGFSGFLGFRYFTSHNLADLFYFSQFGFFSTWFTARLASEMPDERYEENRQKAKAVALLVPTAALFAIGCGLALGLLGQGIVVLLAAVGWAATFITYAVAFWYYEKH